MMMKVNNKEDALRLYEEMAEAHAKATEEGDYKVANNCYKGIICAIDFLNKNDCIRSLESFLDHSAVGVRLWTATHLLSINEAKCLKVLSKISDTVGIHSLTAKTTIREWKNGNLRLLR